MQEENREDRNTDHKDSWVGWKRVDSQNRFNSKWEKRYKRKQNHFHEKLNWQNWDHDHTHWPQFANRQRGLFFFRFFASFALITILVLGGMGAFAYLLSRLFDTAGNITILVWILGCSLSLALPLLAVAIARSVFRGVATPIADVMTAAEAVGQGDLSVQVPLPIHGPEDFRKLVDSFNNMIAELARLDEQRRNLTADVAHELRTPLHIIQGNLEGILDGVYQPTPEQITVLLDEIRLLTRLVQDLQTLSLADAGQLTLNFEPVEIPELLNDITTSFSGQIDVEKIDMQVQILEETSAAGKYTNSNDRSLIINADPSRLDQIITNLVANALRYTNEGGSIILRACQSSNGVIIQVADSGVGISDQDLPFIFDRFWKGDQSRIRSKGAGSGLGLAISRKLVEAHGGHITVESKLGFGTTFTFDIPNH